MSGIVVSTIDNYRLQAEIFEGAKHLAHGP